MMKKTSVAFVCLLGAATAAAPQAAGQTLTFTLDEAIATARRFNPTYRQALNSEGPAVAAVRHAYSKLLLPQPSLLGSATFLAEGEPRFGQVTFGQQPAFRISNYQIGLDYRFSGQTLLRPGQAQAQRRSVEERITAAEIGLRAEVSGAYLEVLRLREQAAQARRERERAQQHLRFARAREAVGAGTTLETKQAEVALGRAEVAVLQANNAARVSVLRFAQSLGIAPPDSLALVTQFEVFEPRWERSEILALGMEENPSLRSLRATEDAAKQGVRIARSSYLPSVSLSANWSGFTREATDIGPLVEQSVAGDSLELAASFFVCEYLMDPPPQSLPLIDCASEFEPTQSRIDAIRTSTFDAFSRQNDQFPFDFQAQPRSITLAVSVPVSSALQIFRPIPGLRNLSTVFDPDLSLGLEEAEAARRDAAEQARALELQLRADITEAFFNLETAHQTVLLQGENRERALEELRLAQERFRLGAGTFLELLDSQTLAAQAEVDYINAIYAFHNALAALEAAVGRPLER